MKKALVTIFLFLLSNSVLASTMTNITYCEDAKKSNSKAKVWEKNWTTRPTTDKEYIRAIRTSPWCRYKSASGSKHNRIYHVKQNGTEVSILIHKDKESNWIKNNWGKITDNCKIPNDLHGNGWIVKKYKSNPKKTCVIIDNGTGSRLRWQPWTKPLRSLKPSARRR